MNRLEEYGYAGLYKALKHKYKYALSTNLPCVSRRSQFLALLCIFPELISLQESCRSRFRLSSHLFGCLKCLLLQIFRHTLEIINDHPSLVVKVAKSFCKNTKYCRAKSKFRYFLSVEFMINQSTINFKSGQSVLAIHDSPPYCWDQWGHTTFTTYHEQRLWTPLIRN